MGKSDNNTPLVDPGGRPLPPSRPPSGWRKIREACDELIPEKFRALFKQIPQSLRWFFALLLFVVLPFGAQTHETWSQWLVVQKVSSWIRQPLLPKARHFAIAIARLENDTDDALRALMIDGLHGVSSIALLNIDRFPAVQGAANVQEAERKGHQQAVGWLRKSGADILIWGHVLPAAGKQERMIRLFFTCRDSERQESSRISESQALLLPAALGKELETVVRAQVLARLGSLNGSQPIAVELEREIAWIQPTVEAWPSGGTGAVLRYTLAGAQKSRAVLVGDKEQLKEALENYQKVLQIWSEEKTPELWAMAHNSLGNALYAGGLLEQDPHVFQKAVASYRKAARVWNVTPHPRDFALVQGNLGVVLLALGEREGDTKTVEAAVAAFEQALRGSPRDSFPLDWARIKNNLGIAYFLLGKWEGNAERLNTAIRCYRAALEEWHRELVPMDWAMAQHNLGNALKNLSDLEDAPKPLAEALAAYRAALEQWTRERSPMDWASATSNLGTAVKALGERTEDPVLLQESVRLYRDAMQVWTRERSPMNWALTQNNLGNALRTLARYTATENNFSAMALIAYKEALKVWTMEVSPYYWALIHNNMANVLRAMAQNANDPRLAEEALAACREALKVRTRERLPMDWALSQFTAGQILVELWANSGDATRLREAVASFEQAQEVFAALKADYYAELAKNSVDVARRQLQQAEKKRE